MLLSVGVAPVVLPITAVAVARVGTVLMLSVRTLVAGRLPNPFSIFLLVLIRLRLVLVVLRDQTEAIVFLRI
tara:strand:- start:498 stop:713 length:216 start_codon:yes stop_codon:yes gene_type:complete